MLSEPLSQVPMLISSKEKIKNMYLLRNLEKYQHGVLTIFHTVLRVLSVYQFASVCRKIERRGLTIGDLLKLVVDYCHRREDKYNYTERSLFDDLTRNNND